MDDQNSADARFGSQREFSHRSRGHDHYWCEGCTDECPFGPCCDVEQIPTVHVVEATDVDMDW